MDKHVANQIVRELRVANSLLRQQSTLLVKLLRTVSPDPPEMATQGHVDVDPRQAIGDIGRAVMYGDERGERRIVNTDGTSIHRQPYGDEGWIVTKLDTAGNIVDLFHEDKHGKRTPLRIDDAGNLVARQAGEGVEP